MHRYRQLRAWECCKALALEVYSATSAFPPAERFGMTSQVRRASISAVINVAEGSAKAGKAEFARYLDIALASLAEVDALVDLALGLGYLLEPAAERLLRLREEASKVTFALKRRMRT